ncbi:hypothetical protein Dimus_022930 [Dionaea muscipula]
MAGKRGRPRKGQTLQWGSIVSQRGVAGLTEQGRFEEEKTNGSVPVLSRDLGASSVEVALEDVGKSTSCGVVSEVLKMDLVEKTMQRMSPTPTELKQGRGEGIYLAAARRAAENVVGAFCQNFGFRGKYEQELDQFWGGLAWIDSNILRQFWGQCMFQSNKEYSVRMGYRALRGNMETVPWTLSFGTDSAA